MKSVFYIGAIAGGILGVVIAMSMDILLGQRLGGGWSEAVANDLNRMFHINLYPTHFIVIIGVIVVVGMIGVFGALIGGIFSVIVAQLFVRLTKEE